MTLFKHIIFITLFLSVNLRCIAQPSDYYEGLYFHYLTMEDGLSNYKVNAIYKDKMGFMWFGTNEGLNRFDGYDFEIFKNIENDASSLSNNFIRDIMADESGNLVIGHENGVDVYNLHTGTFRKLAMEDGHDEIRVVWELSKDKHGNIWICASNGLYFISPGKNRITNYASTKNWLKNKSILSIKFLKNDDMVMGTSEEGVLIYNEKKDILKNYSINTNANNIYTNWTEKIYVDKNNEIWAGTYNFGIRKYDPVDSSFRLIKLPVPNYRNLRIRDITEDELGRLWVGSIEGLFMKEPDEQDFKYIANTDNINARLLNSSIFKIYFDDQNLLWLGTYSGGVNYCNLNENKFKHYDYKKGDNRYLNDRVVFSVIESRNDKLYIGTERGGLNIYDRKKEIYSYFTVENSDIKSNNIKTIVEDAKGNFWIGTFQGGLSYFNSKTNSFKTYLPNNNNPGSISNNIIYSLCIDKNNNLWVGTVNGLDLLKNNSNTFNHFRVYNAKRAGGQTDNINIVFIDRDENLWVGSEHDGLYKFNDHDSVFYRFSEELAGITLNTIHQDRNGNLWLGANSGLYRLHPETKKIVHLSEKDGLPVNTVFRILDDKEGNIWLTTTWGLTKFKNAVNDISTPQFFNFNNKNGLRIQQFKNNSYFESLSGEMFFGGVVGFISFIPENINIEGNQNQINITKLKVFNKPVKVDVQVEGMKILDANIGLTNKIELSHRHKVVTFEFSSLVYNNAKNIIYAYKLEGFDKDWNLTSSTNRSATYTNLKSKEYELKIKATNGNGVWNENYKSLKIYVIPPFWQRTWFYIFVAGIVLFSFYFIMRMRTYSLTRMNSLLENRVENRTKELSAANEQLREHQEEIMSQNIELEQHRNNLEHLILNRTYQLEQARKKAEESDRLKSSFLANMSHEIRTPLNAIVGFSNLLISEENKEEQNNYANIINKNSETLMVLINDILDISKIEANQLTLYYTEIDINQTLTEIENTYKNLSPDTVEIKYIRKYNEKCIIYCDETRLNQVLVNLLNNALKFTEKGHIHFGYLKNDKSVNIYVEDTGIGIQKEKLESIFNYFEKIEEDHEKVYRGTGIGLFICKKVIQLMGGKIWVESEKKKGSTFYFSLPFTDHMPIIKPLSKNVSADINHYKIEAIIAEDEEFNYILLERMLKSMNINVRFWSQNGNALVNYMKNHDDLQNCVVFMDIKMPELDGIGALNEIRKFNKQIPIIAVTAYATQQERNDILKNEFNGYVTKPVLKEKLKRTIVDCITNMKR